MLQGLELLAHSVWGCLNLTLGLLGLLIVPVTDCILMFVPLYFAWVTTPWQKPEECIGLVPRMVPSLSIS